MFNYDIMHLDQVRQSLVAFFLSQTDPNKIPTNRICSYPGNTRPKSLDAKTIPAKTQVTDVTVIIDVFLWYWWFLNKLRPRQNDWHFAEDIFRIIFRGENIWIAITIWRKFIPKRSIDNTSGLVKVRPQRRIGGKLLRDTVQLRIYASPDLNELTEKNNENYHKTNPEYYHEKTYYLDIWIWRLLEHSWIFQDNKDISYFA